MKNLIKFIKKDCSWENIKEENHVSIWKLNDFINYDIELYINDLTKNILYIKGWL